jgi:dipeptidyl aminopeptidase/acylaminoacyl peptidase
MSGIDALIASGVADPARLGIGGFSYGGFMTPWAITQTNRFKVAVAGGVVANWKTLWDTTIIPGMFTTLLKGTPQENPGLYAERSPVNQAQHASTPTLIYQGTADTRTPVGQARELYAALTKNKVPAELLLFEGEGHYFEDRNNTVKLMESVRRWFDRYLK